MGQRLVINVFENHEADLPIANCYFHWDAYTRSTLLDTFAWFQAYKALENISDPLLRTVRAFEHMKEFMISKEEMENIQKMLSSAEVSDFIKSVYKARLEGGAGSTTNSLAQLQNKYPDETFQPAVDRNEGLIGVTKDDIEESMNWAEGSVYIYLDDMTWDFDVYYLMDEDSYLFEYDDEPDKSFQEELASCKEFDIEQEFTFDDIQKVMDAMEEKLKFGDRIIIPIE